MCYNCDEKYTTGAVVKHRKLYLLDGIITEENESSQEIEPIEAAAQKQEFLEIQGSDAVETSLHAISGTLNPLTMRVQGLIGKCSGVVLIDSGNTHNFIHPAAAEKAGITPWRLWSPMGNDS